MFSTYFCFSNWIFLFFSFNSYILFDICLFLKFSFPFSFSSSFCFFIASEYSKIIIERLQTTLRKQFLWIKENFVNSKKLSLIQRNRIVYLKENFFESTKLSSIQRNFFFDRISKKCFFDSKKLISGCN